ncbi:MAG: hypothetical protein WC102_09835 [Saccharofermentanales bacterium]
MEENRKKSSWGTVFSAVLLALLVLGFLVFAFFYWIAPYFKLNSSDVYRFCILLLPFLIGIILIVIGVSVRARKQHEFDEALRDRIKAGNLFALPDEEPVQKKQDDSAGSVLTPSELAEKAAQEAVPQQILPTEAEEEDTKLVPVSDSIEDYEQQISEQLDAIAKEGLPSESSDDDSIAADITDSDIVNEINKEDQAETIEEPAAETAEEPVAETAEEPAHEEPAAETIEEPAHEEPAAETAEEPYISIIDSNDPIIKAIDAVKLTDEDAFQAADDVEPVDQDDKEAYITDELDSSERIGYDITLARIYGCGKDQIQKAFQSSAKLFILSDSSILAVIPFYNEDEANAAIKPLDTEYRMTSRKGRTAGYQTVARELSLES